MSQQLEELVWNQPKGYITDPIKTPNGFLILRVEEHQKDRPSRTGGSGERDYLEVAPAAHGRLAAHLSHQAA